MDRSAINGEFARHRVVAGSPFTTDFALEEIYRAWVELSKPTDCWIGYDLDNEHKRIISVVRKEAEDEGEGVGLRSVDGGEALCG
jgi:hypothetical protein